MGIVSLEVPPGTLEDDLLVAYVQAFEFPPSGSTTSTPWQSPTFPSGWTKVFEDLTIDEPGSGVYTPTAAAIFTKIATLTDVRNLRASFEHAAAWGVGGVLVAYDGSNDPAVVGTPVSNKGTGNEATLPSVAANEADTFGGFVAVNQSSIVSQPGTTMRVNHTFPLGTDSLVLQLGDIIGTGQGPTGVQRWPITPAEELYPRPVKWSTIGCLIRCLRKRRTCAQKAKDCGECCGTCLRVCGQSGISTLSCLEDFRECLNSCRACDNKCDDGLPEVACDDTGCWDKPDICDDQLIS